MTAAVAADPYAHLPWKFNHPALRDILRELQIEFVDGFDNLTLRCMIDKSCFEHYKPTLNLKCSGENAGIFRCFRCERTGYVDQVIRAATGWGVFQTARYLREHQAYDDPNDCVVRLYDPATDNDLRKFQYRHVFLYERGFDEETCLRFEVGFDQDMWMVTFPVRTADGKLAAIKKRAITSKLFQHIPTEYDRFSLFGVNLIPRQSIIWITEGEMDAMFVDQTLREFDIPNQGAVALSGKHLPQAGGLECLIDREPIYFVNALDNDDEGNEAAKVLYARIRAVAPVMRLQYESDQTKDPNDSSPRHIAAQARRVAALEHTATLARKGQP